MSRDNGVLQSSVELWMDVRRLRIVELYQVYTRAAKYRSTQDMQVKLLCNTLGIGSSSNNEVLTALQHINNILTGDNRSEIANQSWFWVLFVPGG